MTHRNVISDRQDRHATTYTDELTRRVLQTVDDPWIAAAMRLCALALDAGLVTAPELQTAVDRCRTRQEVTPFLRRLAADVILAQGAGGWPV